MKIVTAVDGIQDFVPTDDQKTILKLFKKNENIMIQGARQSGISQALAYLAYSFITDKNQTEGIYNFYIVSHKLEASKEIIKKIVSLLEDESIKDYKVAATSLSGVIGNVDFRMICSTSGPKDVSREEYLENTEIYKKSIVLVDNAQLVKPGILKHIMDKENSSWWNYPWNYPLKTVVSNTGLNEDTPNYFLSKWFEGNEFKKISVSNNLIKNERMAKGWIESIGKERFEREFLNKISL